MKSFFISCRLPIYNNSWWEPVAFSAANLKFCFSRSRETSRPYVFRLSIFRLYNLYEYGSSAYLCGTPQLRIAKESKGVFFFSLFHF